MLSLRRFRAQSSGLSLDKLNRGEVRRRKAKTAAASGEGGEEGEEGEEDGVEDGQPKVVAGLVQGKGSKPVEDECVTPFFLSLSGRPPDVAPTADRPLAAPARTRDDALCSSRSNLFGACCLPGTRTTRRRG